MTSRPVPSALIASCLALAPVSGGCVSTGSDGGGDVDLLIDLFWEEVDSGDGRETCESARIDYTLWRLLDDRGDVVDCYPKDGDGDCLDEPEQSCVDQISAVLPPGEYSLELDGYRAGCRTPQWHAVCESIFLDRFDEQYACIIDGSDECEPGTPGEPAEPADDADAGR